MTRRNQHDPSELRERAVRPSGVRQGGVRQALVMGVA